MEGVVELAAKHDLAHLLLTGVKNNGLVDPKSPIIAILKRTRMLAVYRDERMTQTLKEIGGILESSRISYLLLKGSVIRDYYPETWLRTSGDIDLLVTEKNIDEVVWLLEQNGYRESRRGSHDISLFSPSGQHVEVHYRLLEDEKDTAYSILEGVWSRSITRKPNTLCHEMDDEMLYFYHIVHMAKHFKSGGCGIRSFIDLWLLKQKGIRSERFLEKSNLKRFEEVCLRLCAVWFDREEHDETTKILEEFVINGGVYGNVENRVEVGQSINGGKFRYAFSRIFPPYSLLIQRYPILRKKAYLFPIYQVVRWIELLIGRRIKRGVAELRIGGSVSKTQNERMTELLLKIGL